MSTGAFSTIMNTVDQFAGSGRTALICGEEKLTYRRLAEDARLIAGGLAAAGIRKGDRVLFCMRTSADAIRALFGIFYAGAVCVAADLDWPEERRRFVAEDGRTVFSMTDEAFRRLRGRAPSAAELPQVGGRDEAAVYYTSGSTGEPKGVVLHHIVFGQTMPDEHTPAPKWTVAQIIFKLSFVASIMDSCFAFTRGNTVLMATDEERSSVDLIAAAMEKHHADCMAASASIFARYLENPAFARAFSKLRFVSLGAERVDASVASGLSSVTGADIFVHYASSEMFLCAEYLYRNDGEVHLGKAVPGVRMYLLDEKLEDVLPGREGELFVGGTAAEYGHYLNRPDLNAEKYLEHPRYGRLFRTGDMARLETDGEVTITGRMDRMVKLHGQRIEIAEIENRMGSYPGIRRAAVRLLGESPRELLAGYFTGSQDVSETEFRKYLADHLPYYMVPSLFMHLDAMPENANGKLDYRALPLIDLPKQEYEPPETEREKLLCGIFADVLKTGGPVGVNDHFMALGGDSITGMAVASRLLRQGYSFEVRWLFTAPTARQLAPLLVPAAKTEGTAEKAVMTEPTPGQQNAIEKTVGWRNTECVYPVTRVVEEKLEDKATYLVYGMWETDAAAVDPETFGLRLNDMTAKHQALRSVFCLAEGEEHLQVVLREHKPDCFSVDLRALSAADGTLSPRQKAYFRSLIRLDTLRPRDLEREVLFRAGLIRISETKSILFLSFSHLILDGTGVTRILQELAGHAEVRQDKSVWDKRLSRLYRKDHTMSLRYWQNLLEGCRAFTKIPMKESDTADLSPETFYIAGGKGLYDRIVTYCRVHRSTVSTVIHYAFGRALMEMLATDDVCFLSEGSGRTPEDAELPGMFVLRFPVRLNRRDTLKDCQAQLILSAAHFDVWGIREPVFAAGWEKNSPVLNVQNIFDDPGAPKQIMSTRTLADNFEQTRELERQALMTHMEKNRWFLRVSMDERLALSCSVAYNAARYFSDWMKGFQREMIRQLRAAVKEDA